MRVQRAIIKSLLLAPVVLLCGGCGDSASPTSDAALKQTFERNRENMWHLIVMAERDHAEVLWMTTHELQPSGIELTEDRWAQYDSTSKGTGIRGLLRTDNYVEMDIEADSDSFMQEGAKKGFMYSSKPLGPLVASLDEPIPQAMLQSGVHIVYKQLAPNWYLFSRQE